MRLSITQITLAVLLMSAAPVGASAQSSHLQAAGTLASASTPPARTAGEALGAASVAVDPDYTLGVGDTIQVAVVGRSDFDGPVRVGPDGSVLLPMLGAVPAVDRTPTKLADQIRVALEKGGYFSKPVVRVDVVAVASRYVTVLGAVSAPGLMPLDRRYRLSEVVARAGGSATAGVSYVVLTPAKGTSKQYKIAELATGSGDQDPYVANGDKIYVPAAEAQMFYVTGQVKNPGSYPVTEGMTVRMALARAGGVTETGSDKKVKLTRKGKEQSKIKVDDTVVEAADILDVGERLF
jgi:polysaccharide export outer membrane protein